MAQEIGSAKAIQGQVTATGPEGARTLSVGSPVFKGDTLATAKGAGGSIQFLDKTVLNVGEGSKVSLDQYVYDGGKGSGQALFKMAQGTFRAVTGEIVKQNPESFKMQSPLATIGIRGTETAHTVPGPDQPNGSESHLVMVFDGKPVIVQPLGGGAYQVLSQAGVKVEVGKFGAGPVVVMTPQEYKYYQALTTTGLQQGVPQDTLTPQGGQGQKDPTVKAAQDAANRATAEAQAKAAEAAAAKAAAEAAAKAAAEAAASGDPQAKAAADAAAKAAAEAAAKAEAAAQAAADAAAKAQAEAFAAQQALALAEAAKAAAQAAADAAAQGNQLTLTPGSIISFSTSTDAFGNTTTIITVTPPSGGQGSGAPAPVIITDQAENTPPEPQDDTVDGGDNTSVTTTLDLSGSAHPMLVELSTQQPMMVDLTTSEQTILASTIVNVIGSAYADSLMGNASANKLQGADGNDSISGGDGNDTLIGGAGDDMLDGEDGTDSLVGGLGDDMLDGGDSGDILDAGTGQDSVDGGDGNDAIFMGTALSDADGQDSIDGGGGHDVLYFTDNGYDSHDLDDTKGVEEIVLGNATTSIEFPAGYTEAQWTDIGNVFEVDGSAIASTAGTSGNTLYFDGSSATLDGSFLVTGGGGNDTITGGGGNDTFYGGAGNDSLAGGEGDDSLTGGTGDDTLVGSDGMDTLSGGEGVDTLDYSWISNDNPLDINIGAGTVSNGLSQSFSGIEHIIGGQGEDTITGSANFATIIEGGLDDDVLTGGGKDTLSYEHDGNDAAVSVSLDQLTALDGSGHEDDISGGGFINLVGSAYDDLLTGDTGDNIIEGGLGNDILNGGQDTLPGKDGLDTVSYEHAAASVTVELSLGTATGGAGNDTFSGFENILGSQYSDSLTGDEYNNIIEGGAGNDTLHGGGGDDTMSFAHASAAVTVTLANGGSGTVTTATTGTDTYDGFANLMGTAYADILTGNTSDNIIEGGLGNDTLHGGGGNDTLSFAHASAGVTVTLANGGSGTVTTAATGTDTYNGFANLMGSAYADILTGNAGNNVLHGLAGNDIFIGTAGNDSLYGGDGTNTVDYHNLATAVSVTLTDNINDDGYYEGSADHGIYTDQLVGIGNVIGTALADTITGNSDDNVIEGRGVNTSTGAHHDVLDGGDGTDTLIYANLGAGVALSMVSGTATYSLGGAIHTDQFSNFENVIGTACDDTIETDSNSNIVNAGAGDDIILLRATYGTADTIDGGDGIDTINLQNLTAGVAATLLFDQAVSVPFSPDHIIAELSHFENIIGTNFDDSLTGGFDDNVLEGMAGNDELYGYMGVDTASYEHSTSGVTVNLTDGTASDGFGGTDTLNAIDNITGSAFDDGLMGDTYANVLAGLDGDDLIFGNGGADTLTGGDGRDVFWFSSASGESTVTDFSHDDDYLCFYTGGGDFSAMASGFLFELGSSSTTTQATLLFDTGDSTLYYDADGTGAGAATVVASFANSPTITESNILVNASPPVF